MPSNAAVPARDGSHDFDFDVGIWRTEIVRRLDPFSNSEATVKLTGTVTVRSVWSGKAQVEEIIADGPKGRWEGMTVFLYDPETRQWSMNFANSSVGKITSPMIGSFEGGRGELLGSDIVDGVRIRVRAVWSDFTPTSHKYEEYYSSDDGRSWHLAFTARKTKLKT